MLYPIASISTCAQRKLQTACHLYHVDCMPSKQHASRKMRFHPAPEVLLFQSGPARIGGDARAGGRAGRRGRQPDVPADGRAAHRCACPCAQTYKSCSQDLRASAATRALEDALGAAAGNQMFLLTGVQRVARAAQCGNQVCEAGERAPAANSTLGAGSSTLNLAFESSTA